MNQYVSSFLSTSFNDFMNRLLPNNTIMLKNNGEDKRVLEDKHGGGKDRRGPMHINFESTSRIVSVDLVDRNRIVSVAIFTKSRVILTSRKIGHPSSHRFLVIIRMIFLSFIKLVLGSL